MEIDYQRIALVITDPQNDFLSFITEGQETVVLSDQIISDLFHSRIAGSLTFSFVH